MSLKEQQNLLARLYTDNEFREAFLSSPETVGAANGLSEAEIEDLAGVMPEELNFFAASLFWKRLREVEKFLPLTKKTLGEDFTAYFREFSQNFNPQTVKKHFEDAFEFGLFIAKQNKSEFARTIAKFECAKLEFFGLEKRIVICRMDFDLRPCLNSGQFPPFEIPAKKKRIAVWIRAGKRIRHFFI